MNKEKYLKELEKRLVYLKEEDKQTEIFRISNELDSGKVVKDISVEVDEIYKKYKVNVEKEIKKSNSKIILKLDNFAKKFENLLDKMKKNSFKENAIIIRDIIILLLIVSILKIPFIAVETIILNFSEILPELLTSIIIYVIEILYVIFAIFLFLKMFKKRFKKELK